MTEYVHLIGVEQVQSAAREIRSAADDMKRAADNFDQSVHRLAQAMSDHAERIERAMEVKS